MPANPADLRRHPRYPAELRVRLRTSSGDIEAYTGMVSRGGFSARLPTPLTPGDTATFLIHLPDGATLVGDAVARNALPDGITGFEITFDDDALATWLRFIDEEGSTGGLWRMIGRYTAGAGDDASARAVLVTEAGGGLKGLDGLPARVDDTKRYALRFHTVGENGEAWRVCFERCPSVSGLDSDLVEKIPGFDRLAERAVHRVLVDDVMIRLSEHAPPQRVRVAELQRGGYAYVQGGAGMPVGLVSLGVGELILVEFDGESVFPHFTALELERIACDTFRSDLTRPLFPSSTKKEAPAPITFAEPPPVEGVEAIRRAQDTATRREIRHYGERRIELFPAVWARATTDDGSEVMGPTMRDGARALLLVLVGPGAPRVKRLDEGVRCSLMARHG